MSFFVEDSCAMVTHLFYKAAVILAVLRWALSWALRTHFSSSSSSSSSNDDSLQQSHPLPSAQQIRDGLILTTFGDITHKMSDACDTCAVCLGHLMEHDEVTELRNCRHVFHKECIDRWVGHDDHHDHDHDHDDDNDENHKTCPLCRAPLLTTSQSLAWIKSEPSWAVERILYLFGDDLFVQ